MRTNARLIAATLLFVLAAPAWAVPIKTVGSVDTLMATTSLPNNGNAMQTKWANIVAGANLTMDGRNNGQRMLSLVRGTRDTYAFNFGRSSRPSYFLLKTGKGRSSAYTLFGNNNNRRFGVFTLSSLGLKNAKKIGNVAWFSGGPTASVPEPGALSLLGLGLLGILGRRRRRRARPR